MHRQLHDLRILALVLSDETGYVLSGQPTTEEAEQDATCIYKNFMQKSHILISQPFKGSSSKNNFFPT
jgi:hypothetical protein